MSSFSDRFETETANAIAAGRLLRRDAAVIVALSGGADSVALLSALLSLGYECTAAHCNFHLRGEESMRDMRFCMELCRTLQVPLMIRNFDVDAYRREHGGSVEMACRNLRYRWFDELLDSERAQAIAVGHHCEDRAETFLLNLMRGAGISGLVSMRPRSGNVVRPLLGHSRADIERYLAEKGLEFIIDSTNAANEYRRNRLRNIIIPALEEAFPGAVKSILTTIANLEKTEEVYREAINGISRRFVTSVGGGMKVDVGGMKDAGVSETVLYEMLAPRGFTASQVSDIYRNVYESGLRFISAGARYVAELSRGCLDVIDADKSGVASDVYPVNISRDIIEPLRIDVSYHPVEDFKVEGFGADVAYFDADAFSPDSRWVLRHPRRGDRMVPFGMRRSKLLSDIFSNAKYSAETKRNQWVLVCGDEIVWLPGLRNSAAYSVGPDTKHYIRLSINH